MYFELFKNPYNLKTVSKEKKTHFNILLGNIKFLENGWLSFVVGWWVLSKDNFVNWKQR